MKKDIHIFSPGTQTSAQGVTREFTKKDLKEIADTYNPGVHEAPIRIGHEDNDKVPSWGWVKGVKLKGSDLYAEVEFSPLMEEFVDNKLYTKVSASFYSPESKINPEPGNWSLRHVAMLGAQPPAVKGLKGFAYSEVSGMEGVLDFSVSATEKLDPESVFDEELGPTLKSDEAPIEALKIKLDEARADMAKEEKEKAELEAQAQSQEQQPEEFSEKKMKKAPAGKMGAEDADEEVSEDDTEDMSSCDGKSRKYKEKSYSDEEKHAEAEALRDGKEASVGSAKHDAKMVATDEESDGPGPVVGKQKKKYMDGDVLQDPNKDEYLSEQKQQYSEVEVPSEYEVEEYREGFIQAVLAYKEAAMIDGDVEFTEDEDVTPSFKAGVEAGLEFAEAEVIRNGNPSAVGSAKHDAKMVATDEESEGEGPVASKVKKSPKDGECCEDDAGEYQEPTFDPRGPKGSSKKRGSDGLVTSDTGVAGANNSEIRYKEMEGKDLPESLKKQAAKKKAESGDKTEEEAMTEGKKYKEDEAQHKEVFKDLPDGASESKDNRPGRAGNVKPGKPDTRDYKSKTKVKATKTLIHGDDGMDKRPDSKSLGRQNDQSGRGETGEAGEEGKTFRARGGDTTAAEGNGTDFAREQKGTDGGAQEKDRMDGTGKSKEQDAHRKVTGKMQDAGDRGEVTTGGGYPGSGAAVKKPSVRVMYVGKKGGTTPLTTNFSESEEFSELSARLAELEAANAKLVQEKQVAVRAAHRSQLVEFAESLYAHGQLTPAVIDGDDLVDYMEGLEYGTLEFSEGETAATKLMEILAKLPAQVSFAEIAAHDKEALPLESLDPHEKALRLSKEEGIDYAEALKKSLFTAE